MKVHCLLASTAYHSSFDSSSVLFVWTKTSFALKKHGKKTTPSEGWRAHGDELWKEVEAGFATKLRSGWGWFSNPSDGLLEITLRKPAIFYQKKTWYFKESFGCFCRSDGWVWIKSFQFPIADIKRNTFNNLLWSRTKINYFESMFGASSSCPYLTWTSLLDVFMWWFP